MKTVQVEIFDHTYSLRGDLDEKYVQELAEYVDEKMRSIAAGSRTPDSLRAAVLAAMNLADEVFAARQRLAQLEKDIRPRAERCLGLVEQALHKSA